MYWYDSGWTANSNTNETLRIGVDVNLGAFAILLLKSLWRLIDVANGLQLLGSELHQLKISFASLASKHDTKMGCLSVCLQPPRSSLSDLF
jgi:hypothetical protein